MALVKSSNFCMIALPLTDLGPTNALFAAFLCWFDLVGVRVVCLQGWSPTSAIAMRECGAIVDKQTVQRSFDLFDTWWEPATEHSTNRGIVCKSIY
jgi:hypothetical protein